MFTFLPPLPSCANTPHIPFASASCRNHASRPFPKRHCHDTFSAPTSPPDPSAKSIPIPAVDGKIMSLIVEYAKHHKGSEPPIIDKPLRSKQMSDVCKDKWDADFIDKVGNDEAGLQPLYDLILAANYMDIKNLLHLGCAKVASLIKGNTILYIFINIPQTISNTCLRVTPPQRRGHTRERH